jgi:hypothetical protein
MLELMIALGIIVCSICAIVIAIAVLIASETDYYG